MPKVWYEQAPGLGWPHYLASKDTTRVNVSMNCRRKRTLLAMGQ